MSAAKLAANKANAQNSTGPNDTTKTRLNAVRHGLASKVVVLPGEDQEEYDKLHDGFFEQLRPQSDIERALIDRVVAAAWRLKRFINVEVAFFQDRTNT